MHLESTLFSGSRVDILMLAHMNLAVKLQHPQSSPQDPAAQRLLRTSENLECMITLTMHGLNTLLLVAAQARRHWK